MNQPAAKIQVRRIALRRLPVAWVGIVGLMLGLAVSAVAQESASPSSSPAGVDEPPLAVPEIDRPGVPAEISEMAGRIHYVGPDTYILLDAEGRAQPVPGITYEDFLAAWKQLEQVNNEERRRRYTLESIVIDGEANEEHARLRLIAKIQLLTDEAVDVPLGLLGALLQSQPEFDSSDSSAARTEENPAGQSASQPDYLYFNSERGGYVVHLVGRSGTRRQVLLDLIVPLARDGSETTLPLNCPRALFSHLTLALDSPVASANVQGGTLVASEQTGDGGVRFQVAGAAGPIRLTWQTADPMAGEVDTVLAAAGSIRVSIDGRSVRSDARLTVQSYGGSFDRFRVQLPPGAQLVRDARATADATRANYRISVEDETPLGGRRKGSGLLSQVVLVQLPEKRQNPFTIDLATEQPIGLDNGGPLVELSGFEVLGAVRQYGDVAVEVAGDWQARWDVGDHVRQVDPGELEASIQHAGLTAAFQYDRQPWSLGVHVTPRQFRVHATPQYQLEILSDEARLTVHVAYQVFGARAFEFRVGLAGWELTEDPIDSGGLVDQDRIQVTPGDRPFHHEDYFARIWLPSYVYGYGFYPSFYDWAIRKAHATGRETLVFPLAQSSSRRTEITFTLRRSLSRERQRARLPLPVPRADSVGTGELVVTGAADVELLPDLAASVGLTPTPASDAVDATNGNGGREHHFRTASPEAVFVVERINRTREVTANAAAQIDFQHDSVQVDQQLEYVVRFEPVKELQFEIPVELLPDPQLMEITLISPVSGGEAERKEIETPLSFGSSDTDSDVFAPVARQLRVALPQPRLGQFAVRIRYQVQPPSDVWSRGTWRLPLVLPKDGRIVSQSASVRTPRTLAVALDTAASGSSWKTVRPQSDATATFSNLQYAAERAEPSLPVLLRAVDPNLPSSTIVERVWLQTWLSGNVRQDRAAFRFRTTASQTTIELPPQVAPDAVEVLVDGQPADLVSRGTGRLIVRAPATESGDATGSVAALHTLELRYRQPARWGLIQRHSLTPPQIVGTTALSEVYWQIVLPGDRHIVQSPALMTTASQWQWLGSFWGRRPALSQEDLEQWSQASAQLAPAAADSEHLFTGLAPVSTIEVITAPRWLVVLAASSLVLIIVFVWLRLPRAQRAWIMVLAASAVAGLAIAFPTPALLLAQASLIGLMVATIWVLIARTAARTAGPRVLGPVAVSGGSSQRQLMPRGDSRLMQPVAAASTAPTEPIVLPDSER